MRHRIPPPPVVLIRKWMDEATTSNMAEQRYIAVEAARWGADKELEACCKWLREHSYVSDVALLQKFRRPKPPSLKEQALEALNDERGELRIQNYETIFRALESLK